MIRLVIALPSEAKPLLSHYQLKPIENSRGFKVYQKDDMALVVSGVGKSAAAAATAYLQAVSGNEPDRAWINIGMGGHRELVLGEGILAERVQGPGERPDLVSASGFGPIVTARLGADSRQSGGRLRGSVGLRNGSGGIL